MKELTRSGARLRIVPNSIAKLAAQTRLLFRDFRRAARWVGERGSDDSLLIRLAKLELHARARWLIWFRPGADLVEHWRRAAARYPDDREFLAKQIDTALKRDKVNVAEAATDTLIRMRLSRAIDSRFVIGLVNVYHAEGRHAEIRRLMRSFLGSLRGRQDYRIAATRLSRQVFAHFSRTAVPALPNASTYSERFGSMLDRSAVLPGPRQVLKRVVACEKVLAANSSLTLFDTDVDAGQCRKFVELVRAKLAAGEPFAFIRVGDGEASCLPYEPHLEKYREADAIDREMTWWGKPLDPEERASVAAQVADAVWSSDCIGIPTIPRYLRDIKLTDDDVLENGRTPRGLRSVLYALENIGHFRDPSLGLPWFTSCHVHQDLARWRLYEELFDGVRETVLISCHPRLADVIERRFGTKIAGSVLVPPRHASAALIRDRISDSRRLPEMLEEVIEKIGDLPRGRLVLVGAGYLGKPLVALARSRGGVALDLGSILDYWVGLRTRSYLDLGLR